MNGQIKNDGDWFLASLCMRCEPVGRRPTDGRKKAATWINTHLIHAKTMAEAYQKAVDIGRRGAHRYHAVGGPMKWRFVGVWELLPVYDDLADGKELFWTDYGPLMAETARKQCLTRTEAIKRGATQQPPPPTQKNETASRKRTGVQKTT
ncbi:MAG: DUF4288 domain-containing protein [bacterium]